MRPTLADGLAALQEYLGESFPPELVLRADPRGEDALQLQVARDGGWVWFELRGENLRRLRLEEDRRLPGVSRLADLRAAGGGELLAWRPGKRATLRAAGLGRVLKTYRAGRAAAAADRFRWAAEAAAGTGLRVPTVLCLEEPQDLLELELLPGASFELLTDQADVFYRLGHGLRQFQDQGRGRFPELALHDRAREEAVLDDLAQRVIDVCGALPEGWQEARRLVSEASGGAKPGELVPTHRDLHDGQLLDGERQIGLLDFDLLCQAEPALDVANLSAHLRLRAIQRSSGATEDGVEDLSLALLDGFDRGAEEGFLESLRYYQATTFLRLALVYSLRPKWLHIVPSLVALSERCAHEVGPV